MDAGAGNRNGLKLFGLIASSAGDEMNYVRFMRVELKAVVKQSIVHASGTLFKYSNLRRQIILHRGNVDLLVVRVLVVS